MRFSFSVAVLAMLLPIFSQAAEISGRVVDARSGEPLAGASVVLVELNKGAVTDLKGNFKMADVSLGDHTLGVHYLGYIASSQRVVILSADQKLNVNLRLQPQITQLQELEVIGQFQKESDAAALDREQRADNIVNVVSARTIELSPDITVANVSQRVSGVSLERSSQGDGRYAIIRGMEQRYNNTLINNVKIPSPDAKTRFIPLDIIPAELLLRMEVTKALTPDMEGDAIGGTLNLIMRDAPDSMFVAANVATGYNQFLVNNPYQRWDKRQAQSDPAKEYGLDQIPPPQAFNYNVLRFEPTQAPLNGLYGLTYGNRIMKGKLGFLVSGSYQDTYRATNSTQYSTAYSPEERVPFYTGVQIRDYSTQQQRTGLNAKLDYKLSPKHHFKWYSMYLNMQDIQSRFITDTSFVSNRTGPGTGRVNLYERSRYQVQEIQSHTFMGEHKLRKSLLLDYSLVLARASQDIPEQSEYRRAFSITPDSSGVLSQDSARFDNIRKEWQENSDKDAAAYVNLTWLKAIAGTPVEFKAGMLYRDKERANRFNFYRFDVRGAAPVSDGIEDLIIDSLLIIYNPANALFNAENFTAQENVTAWYTQAKWNIGSLQILTGFRVESTTQAFVTQSRPPSTAPSAAEVSYRDFLPSLHLKYELNPKQNLRASYFKSISRPSYFELVPYRILGEIFDEAGNVDLQRTEADNIDVKWEFYPSFREQFSAGVFYKTIINPVEYGFTDPTGKVLQPQNFGTATNWGVELVAVKFWGDFGIQSNYTFTNSSLTTQKVFNDSDSTYFRTEVRPLQGQSRHIANASLLYRNFENGLNIQLAYVLTGRRIVQISQLWGLDVYQDNLHLLDLSIDKRIYKNVILFGKFTNLLNTPYRESIATGLQVRQDFYSQNYLIGMRMRI
ncbi:MAG: TonB-dependent receptor domain-containing protein [Bacteroidia bacterium]